MTSFGWTNFRNIRVEIDNNSVERTIRPKALNRENALFAGHDAGAENWATIASHRDPLMPRAA